MRVKFLGAIAIALLLILMFAVVAQAAVPQSVIDAIIKDAQDGTIDGHLDGRGDPRHAWRTSRTTRIYQQYSDLEGVLQDYLASLQAPGEQGGQLSFTGGEVFLIMAAGAALIGGGALLRRSQA